MGTLRDSVIRRLLEMQGGMSLEDQGAQLIAEAIYAPDETEIWRPDKHGALQLVQVTKRRTQKHRLLGAAILDRVACPEGSEFNALFPTGAVPALDHDINPYAQYSQPDPRVIARETTREQPRLNVIDVPEPAIDKDDSGS